MLVFNLSGLLIGLLAGAAALGLNQLAASTSPSREVVEWTAGLAGFALVAIPLDLFYRRRRNPYEKKIPLFNPEEGGSLMLLPLWLWGAAAVAGGIYFMITCPESRLDVIDRYKPAIAAKVAEFDAAARVVRAGTGGPQVDSLPTLEPRPYVDRPAGRGNVAFYIPDIFDSDQDVNGGHYEALFAAAERFGVREPGGTSTLFDVRACAGNLARDAEEALAIHYLVARPTKQAELFHLIELKSARVLASFQARATPDAVREALAKLTGGTFVF